MKSPDQLVLAFREAGLKVTPQRQLLFRLLHDNTAHPTAETLYEVAVREMPGISLRTVYQTLTDLAAMGELQQIDLGGGAARFDPNVDDHHHVVCDSCGDVRDVYVANADEISVAGLAGFSVQSARIVFSGKCPTCVATPAAPPVRKK
ncbi:MAG: peroxide-responsive transcriptional repressor PerR [Actinomycetota bacterium]